MIYQRGSLGEEVYDRATRGNEMKREKKIGEERIL